MEKGDVVMVINTDSLFTDLLGSFGVVTRHYEHTSKVAVLFSVGVGGRGSMTHTAVPSDLKVVGKAHIETF